MQDKKYSMTLMNIHTVCYAFLRAAHQDVNELIGLPKSELLNSTTLKNEFLFVML